MFFQAENRSAVGILRKRYRARYAPSTRIGEPVPTAKFLGLSLHARTAGVSGRIVLAEIYSWFTDFDSAGLNDAKALLDELSR